MALYSPDALLGPNDPKASMFGDRHMLCIYVHMYLSQSQEQRLGPEQTILLWIIDANEKQCSLNDSIQDKSQPVSVNTQIIQPSRNAVLHATL